jgi:hypothetical protein
MLGVFGPKGPTMNLKNISEGIGVCRFVAQTHLTETLEKACGKFDLLRLTQNHLAFSVTEEIRKNKVLLIEKRPDIQDGVNTYYAELFVFTWDELGKMIANIEKHISEEKEKPDETTEISSL